MKKKELEGVRMSHKMEELAAFRYASYELIKKGGRGSLGEDPCYDTGSDLNKEMVRQEACLVAADGMGYGDDQALGCVGGELGCSACPFESDDEVLGEESL